MQQIHRRQFFIQTAAGVSAVLVVGVGMPEANAAGNRYEYYRDVYGNGQWGWSSHNYPTMQRAQEEARRACNVGTKVRFIGQFDRRGKLVQRWNYRC